jgi:hypothetical protein
MRIHSKLANASHGGQRETNSSLTSSVLEPTECRIGCTLNPAATPVVSGAGTMSNDVVNERLRAIMDAAPKQEQPVPDIEIDEPSESARDAAYWQGRYDEAKSTIESLWRLIGDGERTRTSDYDSHDPASSAAGGRDRSGTEDVSGEVREGDG